MALGPAQAAARAAVIPMRNADFPERRFNTDQEFDQAIRAMDSVAEEPVTIGGQPSRHYKGLRYKVAGFEVSSVGKDFAVVQHPHILQDLRRGLVQLELTPRGRIEESHRGLLHATLHFFNPRYDLSRTIGALEPGQPCYLGIAVANSHGAPTACLSLDALAEADDGTQYLVSDFLGRKRIRHVGRLRANLHALVEEMGTALPSLGRHVADAKATPLDGASVVHILDALVLGPRAQQAILARAPSTAWGLYHALCRFAARPSLRAVGRMAELRDAQALLDPHRLHRLLEEGQQLERERAAAHEAAHQSRLPEAAAVG